METPRSQTHRERRVEIHRFPPTRRFVTQALRVGRRATPIHGLVRVDMTEALRQIHDLKPQPSVTAYLVAAVGRAAASHPEVHAYRDWRGRLVVHHFADVATLIEHQTAEGSFPLAHLVRDADIRGVADISAEIRRVQADPTTSASGRGLTSSARHLGRIPGAVTMMYRVASRSTRMRKIAGTVAVTSVGMFAGGGGFGIGFPTVMTLSVLAGGLSSQPMVVAGNVLAREVLELTITVDHNLVDGAPAARFVADLRELLESGSLLTA